MVKIILAIVIPGAIALVALAFIFSYLLFRLFGKVSGLNKLAQLYPAIPLPAEAVQRKQRMAVGRVYYANNADICLTSEGFYLWIRPFLSKYEPVKIPWSELRNPKPTIMALQNAVRLEIGDPQITTIVLKQKLYKTIQAYLNL